LSDAFSDVAKATAGWMKELDDYANRDRRRHYAGATMSTIGSATGYGQPRAAAQLPRIGSLRYHCSHPPRPRGCVGRDPL